MKINILKYEKLSSPSRSELYIKSWPALFFNNTFFQNGKSKKLSTKENNKDKEGRYDDLMNNLKIKIYKKNNTYQDKKNKGFKGTMVNRSYPLLNGGPRKGSVRHK